MVEKDRPHVVLETQRPDSPEGEQNAHSREVHGPVAEHGVLLPEWPGGQVERIPDQKHDQTKKSKVLPEVVFVLQPQIMLKGKVLRVLKMVAV